MDEIIFKVASVADITLFVIMITFLVAEILKWLWSLFAVAIIIFVVAAIILKWLGLLWWPRSFLKITFKVATVADISLLVAKITFAVSEIIIEEDVITS